MIVDGSGSWDLNLCFWIKPRLALFAIPTLQYVLRLYTRKQDQLYVAGERLFQSLP